MSSDNLRPTTYRSIPVLKLPATVNARRAVTGNFLTAMSDVQERLRQANVPVVSPQFQPPTPRNVAANVRGFWNSTVRPIVVPAKRHA